MRREDDEHRPVERPEHPPTEPAGTDPETQARATERQDFDALRRARQARVAKVLVVLAIVVVLIVFVIANAQPVKVNFVFISRHPRLIWVMFACAVLGGIAGYLIGKPGRQVRLHRKGQEPQPGKP